jgi:hypothetical protein
VLWFMILDQLKIAAVIVTITCAALLAACSYVAPGPSGDETDTPTGYGGSRPA